MAKRDLQKQTIALRKQGKSYSEIRAIIPVSKSTLSLWLKDMPLTKERIRQLRADNPIRIERYRETRRKQREKRRGKVRESAVATLKNFSERELFIAGFFLYWGEGTKTASYTLGMANTDPAVLVVFLKWIQLLGVERTSVRVRLQLYENMNENDEIEYWRKKLLVPKTCFRKSHIKKSVTTQLTYTRRFNHGTCNVLFGNRDIWEYVMECLEVIREKYMRP